VLQDLTPSQQLGATCQRLSDQPHSRQRTPMLSVSELPSAGAMASEISYRAIDSAGQSRYTTGHWMRSETPSSLWQPGSGGVEQILLPGEG
jgi:hypothetical protein